jgi:hypothetical protein
MYFLLFIPSNRRIFVHYCQMNFCLQFSGEIMSIIPGANPTIASHSASVVKFYSATNSMARFQKKI